MAATIKLDIVSDPVCPWCIIGYQRLRIAIDELAVADSIDIEWQPFELNPDMPAEGEDLRQHIMRKYGSTLQEARRSEEHIVNLGAELDFRFDFFDAMKIVNTRDAHILLDLARDYGKQTALKIRLFNAYFNQRKNISDRQVLAEELQQVSIDHDEAWLRLENHDAREKIRTTESYWHGQGVSAVPTMIFNRTSALTGAQPVAVYKQALTALLSNEDTKTREPQHEQ